MANPFRSLASKIIAVVLAAVVVALAAVCILFQPKPFEDYIPADSLGYIEIPHLSRVLALAHNPEFLRQAVGEESASFVRQWTDNLLGRLNLPTKRMNAVESGVILTGSSAESEQTIKLYGVVLVRVHSFWIRNLKGSPAALAQKLSDANSFVSTENLRGEDIAILTRSHPDEKIFIALHRDAVLLSNQREALTRVLATMDGLAPSIASLPSWKTSPPHPSENSLACGYFSGAAALNLLRDFLVKNYSPFDDVVRTSRFLASLGLDQIQAIQYDARFESPRVVESWSYRVSPSPAFSQSFLSRFLNQTSSGWNSFPPAALPRNTETARFVSLADQQGLWNAFANSLGILTNQESPQNRDLMISMFEGALGFRIQRDLLAHLAGAIAILNVRANLSTVAPGILKHFPYYQSGWILVMKARNSEELKKTFLKIVAEDHPPATQTIGVFQVFYSNLGRRASNPLSGFLTSVPAFAIHGDTFYFSNDKEVLVSSLQTFQAQAPTPSIPLPAPFDKNSPYLSYERPSTTNFSSPNSMNSPASGPRGETLSFSEIHRDPGGFEYLRASSCGFLCEFVRQAVQTGQ